MNIEETFKQYNDEYTKFERVVKPLSSRPDLCAFLLLDKLLPGTQDIVSAATHDEFFLSVNMDEFKKVATQDDIITLIRCGVSYSNEYDCFFMRA